MGEGAGHWDHTRALVPISFLVELILYSLVDYAPVGVDEFRLWHLFTFMLVGMEFIVESKWVV